MVKAEPKCEVCGKGKRLVGLSVGAGVPVWMCRECFEAHLAETRKKAEAHGRIRA